MLIDDLIQVKPEDVNHPEAAIEKRLRRVLMLVRQAVIIRIDNVADYYWRGSEREWWDITDFPNLAPPHPVFWMEYLAPTIIHTEGKRLRLPQDIVGRRQGFLIEAIEPGLENWEARWVMEITPIDNINGNITISIPYLIVGVTPDGKVSRSGGQYDFYYASPEEIDPENERRLQAMVSVYHPVFLAISFMHCRNVRTVEAGGRRTASNKRKRRPSLRHVVLEIDAMRRKTEGQGDSHGLKRALHICRGHFANYESKGLFGKLRGIFWRPQHVRGQISAGVVIKEYNIHSDRE